MTIRHEIFFVFVLRRINHHFRLVVVVVAATVKAYINDRCGRQWFNSSTSTDAAAAAAVAFGHNVIAAASIIRIAAGQ